MRRNIVRLIVVAVIGGLVYLLSLLGLGWGGGGGGGGRTNGGASSTRPAATQTADATTRPASTQPPQPKVPRPLEIVIEDRSYLVQGKPVSLEELERMLRQIPEGSGPAVMVNRLPSSRAQTESILRLKLEDLKLTSSWSPPL